MRDDVITLAETGSHLPDSTRQRLQTANGNLRIGQRASWQRGPPITKRFSALTLIGNSLALVGPVTHDIRVRAGHAVRRVCPRRTVVQSRANGQIYHGANLRSGFRTLNEIRRRLCRLGFLFLGLGRADPIH
jgi:hypothetical protein